MPSKLSENAKRVHKQNAKMEQNQNEKWDSVANIKRKINE